MGNRTTFASRQCREKIPAWCFPPDDIQIPLGSFTVPVSVEAWLDAPRETLIHTSARNLLRELIGTPIEEHPFTARMSVMSGIIRHLRRKFSFA